VGVDERYLPAKEQWSEVLTNLKQRGLEKEDPAETAHYLREKRNTLMK
jgi:DNA repair protein SbcD/Mre11